MKERLLHTPEGVRDIYNSECAYKLELETMLTQTMNLYGFENIQTPMFEYFEIFSEERGTVKAKDMYKFFDREGNTLVLRPDITPSVARCVAKYYFDETHPIRLCYNGNTFLNSNEYQGKPKEITQIGAELIGDGSVQADADMLALTIESLLTAGLEEFQVEVGETGFFKAIIAEAGIDAIDCETIRHFIIDKNSFGLKDFLGKYDLSDELRQIFYNLPTLFGPFERLESFKSLTTNPEAIASVTRLEQIYNIMKLYGYEKYISFDLGMLSKFSYYTGIIFNAYTYGTGEPLISGGRYDKLVGQFGRDLPAIGMAVYVDRLLATLIRNGSTASKNVIPERIVSDGNDFEQKLKEVIAMRREGRPSCLEIK